MEPIINPWYFYLMSMSNNVSLCATLGAITFGIVVLVMFIFKMISCADGEEESFEKVRHVYRWAKICFFILLIIGILFPSEKTIIQMMVAQQVTPNNVNKAISAGKSVKDEITKDVIDLIREFTKEQKSEKK